MSQPPATRNKIYHRLFAPYVLILLIALGGTWLIASQLFTQTLQTRLQDQLSHTVKLLASGNIPLTPQLLQQLAILVRAQIVLIDRNGAIYQSALLHPGGGFVEELQALLPYKLKHQPEQAEVVTLAGQQFMLLLLQSRQLRDPRVYAIGALASLADIQQTRQRVAAWLWASALAGLLILMFIGFRLSRSITQPIQELAKMATEIAQGDRHVQAPIHRQDEIGHLAEALNEMARKLSSYEQEIARHSRMAALGKLTARIAHEIHNPLTAIKMQLQLLRESAQANDVNLIDRLLDEARRLELMVMSTLQYRKIPEPVFQPTRLNEVIEELHCLLQAQFEHQGLRLELHLDPDLPERAMDRDMMTQILLNLLLNARDALPEGGVISISNGVSDDRSHLYFAVDDNGPGIAEQDRDKLFSDSLSEKPGGFGLGLKLCAELAKAHQGKIEVTHSKLGGARFIVLLPLAGMN